MSVEQPHEEKETLSVDVIVPGHEPRTTTPLFTKTKKMLIESAVKLVFELEREAGRCWICNRTAEEAGQPLEAHHFGVERSFIDAKLRWDLLKQDFPAFDWRSFDPAKPEVFVDNMVSQGLLLCKEHHTGKGTGIHDLPFSLWIIQRYLVDGTRFSPTEVIEHVET